MQSFREKWLEAVEKKNSVLCAGLDPAEYGMGRGEKGLQEGKSKNIWAFYYINAVAPYCAALKPNIQYWKNEGGMEALNELNALAHSLGLVVIEDSKLADIGSTNDAGMFYCYLKQADAVTLSPFAGNMQEAVKQAHEKGTGLISMCLMSNPEYEREKNKLVPLNKEDSASWPDFLSDEAVKIKNTVYAPQYLQLARDAQKFGVEAIVIGAPSTKNHIKEQEIANIRGVVDSNMLVLLPGVGFQEGEAKAIWKYFGKNNVIVNVGRSLMLPKGSNSTPQQQAETAKQYRDMLNQLRKTG